MVLFRMFRPYIFFLQVCRYVVVVTLGSLTQRNFRNLWQMLQVHWLCA